MAKIFSNFIYFLLLFIIQIKNSLLVKEKDNSCKYNSFILDCQDPNKVLKSEKNCSANETLGEDGVSCLINNTINGTSIQKNYFGVFFNELKSSTAQEINIPDSEQFNAALENDCLNEYTLTCQNILNFCAYEIGTNNKYGPNCTKVKGEDKLNKKMFLDKSLLKNTAILSNIKYSLDDSENMKNYANSNLNFWVAKYYFNGSLLMFQQLEYDFLQCSNSNSEKKDYKFFGNNIESTCFIDITKYYNYKDSFFYEIYLETNLEGKPKNLTQIPIKIDDDTVVKRMFLHFNYTGIHYYAKKVKLVVVTRAEEKEEKILLPYFEVEYAKEEDRNKKYVKYTFISEYKSDISKFIEAMEIILIIICVIVFLLVIYRAYVWIKMNPSELIESNYILLLVFEFFYKLFKYTGKFFFWYTFGISAYWYLLYKLQFRIYYLMPPLDDASYTYFKIIFYLGFCSYIMYMLIRIYKQVSFDIFFIDWETEKNMAMNDIKSSLDEKVKYKKYRSAWRMIHVVNQFNELQKTRIFHLYFAFTWVILLYFCQTQWYKKEHQVPRDAMVDKSPVNFILRNFIVGIIILSSVAIELCLARLLQIWIPLKKQEFMDLCSVSNISVFILDGLLHGYYIHGLSPIGKADVNYDELFKFLQVEGAGSMRNRGLENDNDEDHCKNQSYEMFISNAMRTIYDGLYIIQTESMLAKGMNSNKYFRKSKLGMRLFRNFLNYEKDQTLLDNYMNNQLKTKIDIVSSNIIQYIKDKTFLQRIMGYTIDNTEFVRINAPDIIFYRDYRQNFDDILFSGMEWEWFIMDLFFLQLIMIASDDIFLAMFLTFIFDEILYYIRGYFGNRNVAKKAVVDERFLN